MAGIDSVSHSVGINEIQKTDVQQNRVVLKEQEPDTVEIKTKPKKVINPVGVATAGAAAVGGAKVAYEGLKRVVANGLNWVETETKNFLVDKGKDIKDFKGISQNLKTNLKYGIAGVGALLTAALVFKDSDKDGKLDILEAFSKFKDPNN